MDWLQRDLESSVLYTGFYPQCLFFQERFSIAFFKVFMTLPPLAQDRKNLSEAGEEWL